MKNYGSLKELDVLDLLNEYKSEMRKLSYKMGFVKEKIKELDDILQDIKSNNENKSTTTFRAKKQEKQIRKPYPLSAWDQFIIQTIAENGRATLSKVIYDTTIAKAKESGIFSTEKKAMAKINQCLVKLTSRRDDVKKVKYKGRGNAYALPDFFDEKGKLKKEHLLKQ